jgi:Type II CAAX prenyl endopeptidase Rce1-like
MSSFSLPEFFVILGLGLLGAAAILPYSFALAGDKLPQAKLPLPVLALISFLQTALLIAIATGIGLLAAQPVGLSAPYIQATLTGGPVLEPLLKILPPAIALAVLTFALMALLERYVFATHVPETLSKSDVNMPVWKRLLASFYGGLDEEILMRLFLVSGLVWVLSRFWQNPRGMPANGAYWTAILMAALLFGLGHLPATRNITPLTPMLVIRAITLNGIAGIAFGWLYWQYGLEAAMLSHFCADILLHVLGPTFASHIYSNAKNMEAQSDSK